MKASTLVGLALIAYFAYLEVPLSDYGSSSLSFNALALAIQTAEGYYPGSRSYRNNNPGNLRYAGQLGSSGSDSDGFAVFPTYQAGFQALINQLSLDASRHPDWTLAQFVANYAPASDNNDDNSYLNNIVNGLTGATGDTTLGEFSS